MDLQGWGSDDKALLAILSSHSAAQRLQMGLFYKTMYGRDLRQDLKSETSGHFEDAIKRMMCVTLLSFLLSFLLSWPLMYHQPFGQSDPCLSCR